MGQVGWSGTETPLGKTSTADFRRFLGALWVNTDRNPLLRGGDVSGRPDLRYAYADGVGAVRVGDGSVVLNWAPNNTALVTTPSVARTDVIYCDKNGAVRVGSEGTFNEAEVIVLRRMRAPAGMTATSQATPVGTRTFALPYGASVGWLGAWIHIYAGDVSKNTEFSTLVTIPFWVPTNRIVDIQMHQSIHGRVDYGLPDSDARKEATGAMAYRVSLDGTKLRQLEMPYSRWRAVTNHSIHMVSVAEGEHLLRVERRWTGIGADPIYFGGGADLEEGNFVGVQDMGVSASVM